MKIKTKLTLNVIIVVIIVAVVAATSFIAMGVIKEKLAYLTGKSTPYQIRTVEFQRGIQAAISDLIKLGDVRTTQEFERCRKEVDASLHEVKESQRVLEEMSGEKLQILSELEKMYAAIIQTSKNRLSADEEATLAEKAIRQKMAENSARLNALEKQIKLLQVTRATAFSGSAEEKDAILSRVRSLEMLKTTLKDLKIAV